MAMIELLKDTFAYIPPSAAISGLSVEDAGRRIDGASHSIVEIVAHLAFWQEWFLARCGGEGRPMVGAAADGWPSVIAADWPSIHDRFIAGIDAAVALASDPAALDCRVTPAIEFPPLAEHSVRDALTHVAVHNAHHLGQIVTLRQLMGRWPPEGGIWTW